MSKNCYLGELHTFYSRIVEEQPTVNNRIWPEGSLNYIVSQLQNRIQSKSCFVGLVVDKPYLEPADILGYVESITVECGRASVKVRSVCKQPNIDEIKTYVDGGIEFEADFAVNAVIEPIGGTNLDKISEIHEVYPIVALVRADQ